MKYGLSILNTYKANKEKEITQKKLQTIIEALAKWNL